jgi:UDP-N-acetylglucosamine 2-epimerase (non-hydrolysing)/GDP/UDP-N,N'-diacetylbacillosamine 2-epimerase (hydrolysing)
VPSFGIPTLDIGDRQKGRIAADSVIHCGYSCDEIKKGLDMVLVFGKKSVNNPYYKEGTCDSILQTIKTYPLGNIVQKHFFDINQ